MNRPYCDDRPVDLGYRVPDAILVSKRYGMVVATYPMRQPFRPLWEQPLARHRQERMPTPREAMLAALVCFVLAACALWLATGRFGA
jgi:hypothetical protein